MPVKVDKLFKDSDFVSYPTNTKLLYIYLVTNPSLNIAGVFSPNIDVAMIETGLSDKEFRDSLRQLISKGRLYVKRFSGVVYFIIPSHIDNIPKSQPVIKKVNRLIKEMPEDLVTFLDTKLGISTMKARPPFKKPTAKEVTDYALGIGYLIDGEEFVRYYDEQSLRYGKDYWVDGRGTQMKDWKAKLKNIWAKEDKKLKAFDDAPEGFKHFYINDGKDLICPDGWRAGKPFSKNLINDMKLKKEYERLSKHSN